MKKDKVRKLQKLHLFRETLQNLTSSDAQKVEGGIEDQTSCQSAGCPGCIRTTGGDC